MNRTRPIRKPPKASPARRSEVRKRLLELGLDRIELSRSEAHMLPELLHKDEIIGGAISGRGENGHIMLVATNVRVLVIDCKPLFNDCEDISYDVVAGVSLGKVGPFHTLSLYTRLGDFKLKTLYGRAAIQFKRFIDKRCIEQGPRRY